LAGKKPIVLSNEVDSMGVEDLVANMIHFNPQIRKNCSKLMQHKFFSKYKKSEPIEWVSIDYPFSDKNLFKFADNCGGVNI
jgi:hypothetical protein